MSNKCCVPGCPNRKDNEVLHSSPRCEKTFNVWVAHVGNPVLNVLKRDNVRSDLTDACAISTSKIARTLRHNAVPTLFVAGKVDTPVYEESFLRCDQNYCRKPNASDHIPKINTSTDNTKTSAVRGGVLPGNPVRNSDSLQSAGACAVCGAREKLLRCARCREVVYCGKQHQREDWARHKRRCRTLTSTLTSEGSSESEILSACAQTLLDGGGAMPEYQVVDRRSRREYPAAALPPYVHSTLGDEDDDGDDPFREICNTVVRDMNQYGLCVLDDFLGAERGSLVLREVMRMYSAGIFKDGQLVSSSARTESKTIRGDQIAWMDGKEAQCLQIGQLIQQVDNIIMRANRMSNNGKMGDYVISGRTKAMVACYPGSGSHYVKHVDNPNKDGRCITAIYYLNRHWDVGTCGGLLRIFPEGWADQVADIAPLFDRILFFWSDRRNPHEVQPAFHTRYAITLWYFDAVEREEATRRYRDNQIAAAAASSSK